MSAALKTGPLLPYELEIIKGPHAGQRYQFESESITIGRGTENQIVLAQDLRASRQHAEIRQADGVFSIINTSQKNYVLVDGVKIQYHQLSGTPILSIGESEIVFRSLEKVTPQKLPPTNSLSLLKPELAFVPKPHIPAGGPAPGPALTPMAPPGSALAPTPALAPASVPAPGTQDLSFGVQNFQASLNSPGTFKPRPPLNGNNRLRLYLIIGVAAIAIYFIFFDSAKKPKKSVPIRGSEVIEREILESQERIEKLEARVSKQNSVTYRRAEENFIKGFRDYQKGQYLRAKEYFRIVLNLNSEHIEARKYYEQSSIKLRKMIEMNFLEGLKSKEKKNYRMCRSFFSNVLVLTQGDRTSYDKYDEAEKFLRECNLGLEGRF